MITQYQVRDTQAARPPKLEVNITTVYLRTNIQCIETEEFTGWEYDETQYTIREFQELIANKTTVNEEYNVDIDFRLSMIELGLS